jgi:N-acetylmuramic acid 6-phosphate etherase
VTRSRSSIASPRALGIEAGGTGATVAWANLDARESNSDSAPHRARFGPANLQLLSDRELQTWLRAIADAVPGVVAVGIGMAGARTARDRQRIETAARRVWPRLEALTITNDLEIALEAAALQTRRDSARQSPECRILVLSGTGACCYGRRAKDPAAQVGGWGHLLGDQGSAYSIALEALRGAVQRFSRTGEWENLGARLLSALCLNEPNDLISWVHNAAKHEIAALAPQVFAAANERDPLAREVIRRAATDLAEDALACFRRLGASDRRTQFVLAGGVLLQQPSFARQLTSQIRTHCPAATFLTLTTSGAEGALECARRAWHEKTSGNAPPLKQRSKASSSPIPTSAKLSPTETRNPRSMELDQLSTLEAVDLMLREDARIPAAIRAERASIARAVNRIARALRQGGRLFYVGAGSSGRLGVLDASECPPTFRTPPEWVQGVIAGGAPAVFRSVEAAEDDVDGGARAMRFRRVSARDVVVGVAASGRTPFVWGALQEARNRGAFTILITFNPFLEWKRGERPPIVICPRIGPEVLTGSTRLKSGTATKLILNMFTTLAMVRLGKVVSNLMVDVNPSNAKLRERAIRITRELTGASEEEARAALEKSGWIIKPAAQSLGVRRT